MDFKPRHKRCGSTLIKKTAGGRYAVRIYHKGSQVAMRTFDTKKAAERWEAAQKLQLQSGSWVDPSAGDISLGDLIAEFNSARRGAVAEHTWDTDAANFHRYVSDELKRLPVSLVSPATLDTHYGELLRRPVARPKRSGQTMARPTVLRVRDSLSSLFTWAETRGVVSTNPVTKSRVPSGNGQAENKVRPFTLPELDAVVLAAAQLAPHYSELIEFLALTGLRWGEAAALRVSAVADVPHPALIISRSKSTGYTEKSTKNGRVRRVPLIDRAADIITNFTSGKHPDDMIFTGARGGQLNGRNFVRAVKWDEIAPGHRVQDLRHTAATSWLQAGVDVKTVSVWLGHSDTSITLRIYIHWMGSDSDSAGIDRVRAARREPNAVVTPILRNAG